MRQLCDLGLKQEVQRKILRENAFELFNLSGKQTPVETVVEVSPALGTESSKSMPVGY